MAKLTAEEFIKKYTEGENKLGGTDEQLIALMEDISDSVADNSEELNAIKAELEALQANYDDLKERYKMRFLSSEAPLVEASEAETTSEENPEEEEEEKVIDIKEI